VSANDRVDFWDVGTGTGLTLDNNGNVGIGTTGPGSLLHLNGATSNAPLTMGSTATGYGNERTYQFRLENQAATTQTALILTALNDSLANVRDLVTFQHTGNVGIGTTAPGSKLSIASLGSSTGTAMVIDASGDVWKDSSSVRYKENIKDLDLSNIPEKLLELNPISFNYKGTGASSFGYLAEDVAGLGLTDLVIYDASGQPDALRYDKLGLYLVEGFKMTHEGLEALTATDSAKTTKIAQLEAQVDELEAGLPNLIINTITNSIKTILASIKDKVELAGEWVFDKLGAKEIDTQEITVQEGINLKDQENDDYYCLTIKNGEIHKTKGLCEDQEEQVSEPETTPEILPEASPAPLSENEENYSTGASPEPSPEIEEAPEASQSAETS